MGKKIKRHGMVELVPRDVIPPAREYPDTYALVWAKAAKLKKDGHGLRYTPERGINALRCALVRAKKRGRVPQDVRVRDDSGQAYLYR